MWTFPFGAGTSSRACSYPGGLSLPLLLQGKSKRRASQKPERRLRSCSRNKVRLWWRYVPVTRRKVQANNFWVFQRFPWTPAIERKAKGKVAPALFLQERTCKVTRRAATFLKAQSSSCREVQHSWRGWASTGALRVLQHLDSWGSMKSIYKMSPCAEGKP